MPLNFEKRITFTSGTNEIKLDLQKQTKLLIYKANGKMKAEVVTYIPNNDYLTGISKRFSGIILVEDWDGSFRKQFYCKNGRFALLNKNARSVNAQAKTTCYYLNIYDCDVDEFGYLENCMLIDQEFLGCQEEQEEIDWIDNSDGGSGGTAYYEEFFIKDEYTWTVYDSITLVLSKEQVKGKRVDGRQYGGYFTGIEHKGSGVFSTSWFGWKELDYKVESISDEAKAWVKGEVLIWGQSSIPVEKTDSKRFNEVFK